MNAQSCMDLLAICLHTQVVRTKRHGCPFLIGMYALPFHAQGMMPCFAHWCQQARQSGRCPEHICVAKFAPQALESALEPGYPWAPRVEPFMAWPWCSTTPWPGLKRGHAWVPVQIQTSSLG
jgi:hypothetical protein